MVDFHTFCEITREVWRRHLGDGNGPYSVRGQYAGLAVRERIACEIDERVKEVKCG